MSQISIDTNKYRTHVSGQLSAANVGQTIRLAGWVAARRDHGKLVFIDLRDATGSIQLVFTPGEADSYKLAQALRSEWVICVEGVVAARPAKMVNAATVTGEIELPVSKLEIISQAATPPFALDTDGHEISEDVRLRYRYLDLRRERLQRIIRLRSDFVEHVRRYLFDHRFAEIETPYFTSPTPEGARDFVVPSRLHPGTFFALPQSPQQYKQLLMVAGFERYFQMARCFRDEDLRADRGFEHTQVDMEMSFVTREDVMALDEAMMIDVMEGLGRQVATKPFPRFTYQEAVAKFGSDKFDVRTEEDKEERRLAFAWVTDFPFFEKTSEGAWTFTHNPFSMPLPEHLDSHLRGSNINTIVTQQYDLVCNGFEVGGGSIRAHQPEVLRATFKIMGYSEEAIEQNFGHMLEAFSYGVPPHGGIAHGVERLMMTLTDEPWLREVQAFPQTSSGRTSVMAAPAPISAEQLKELHIKIDLKG